MLKHTPKELNLQQYHTAKGFAKLLGLSLSYIRNIECGSIEKWDRVAGTIEKKTGVSKDWLLDNPHPKSKPVDINRELWDPAAFLDPLHPEKGFPNWRKLMAETPGVIPKIMANTVQTLLKEELATGGTAFMEGMVRFLNKHHDHPAITALKESQKEQIAKAYAENVWPKTQTDPRTP